MSAAQVLVIFGGMTLSAGQGRHLCAHLEATMLETLLPFQYPVAIEAGDAYARMRARFETVHDRRGPVVAVHASCAGRVGSPGRAYVRRPSPHGGTTWPWARGV